MARFIRIPFGLSGDRTAVPDAVQPGGEVSFSQGFGPDYEIAPGDPGWKPVPRDESNGLYFDIFDNIRQYQLYGVPEWVDASQNAGVAVSYPLAARVRHNDVVYGSVVANNTVEPGTDPTKWVVDEPFSIAVNVASLAQAIAGTDNTKLITPARLASAAQRGAWNYAVAGGTANALTVTLSPAPAALTPGFTVAVKTSLASTGAATLNVNGLGAVPIAPLFKMALGAIYTFVYDGTNFNLLQANAGNAVLSAVTRAKAENGAFVLADNLITQLPISAFSDDGQTDWTKVGNTLVCQRTGRYQVLGNFGSGSAAGLSALTMGIRLNGAEFFSSSLRLTTAAITQLFGGDGDIVDFTAGDVLDFWGFQQSGASRTVNLVNRIAITRLTGL